MMAHINKLIPLNDNFTFVSDDLLILINLLLYQLAFIYLTMCISLENTLNHL
jgi:hypothetical protein